MKKKSKQKVLKKSLNTITTGTLRVHPRGFGFCVPEDREKWGEDIFIPKHLLKGGVDGDGVEIEINLDHPSEKGLDGKVTKILKRGRSHIGGTVLKVAQNGAAFAYSPLLGSQTEIKIAPTKERKFQVGDRLVIEVSDWGSDKKEAGGKMSSYLGHISDPSCDVAAAIKEFELPDHFPPQVIEEAKKFGTAVHKKEMEAREDLRHLECFTIDPDTAKDFDDALSLTQDKKGHFRLGVHIADVSHYVRPGTALDNEARKRCNSTYLPGSVVPMLPHELSSHLCSLKPQVNRLAASVLMILDEEGTVLEYRITRSTIKSAHRFTYKEAKEVLDGKAKSKHKNTLFLMCELCHRLKRKRYERGSIEFSIPSMEMAIGEDGMPKKMEIVEYDITHQLVEEFMLKANEVIATHLAKEGKPLTYRIHDEPNPENMKEFAQTAKTFGFQLSSTPTPEELQNLFDEARGSPFGQFLATSFIRSMKLASYSVQNIGHYGLGLEFYTHFTSPIRRYIDLVVHRVLFNEIMPGENLDQIALQCSEQERLSAKAENSVMMLKKLRLLQLYQKKEPQKVFEATITQVKPFGIIFEIAEMLLEGFLPLSALDNDYFVFQETRRQLIGNKTQLTYKSGEKIQVQLSSLDLVTQETRWRLQGKEDGKRRKKRRR